MEYYFEEVWAKSFWNVIVFVGLASVWILTFKMSYHISSVATGEIIGLNIKEKSDTTAVTSPEIAQLRRDLAKTDSIIAIAKSTVNAGENAKYKGVTVENGQILAKNGNELAQNAFNERKRILTAIAEKESRMRLFSDSKTIATMNGVAAYGKHIEWLKLLFVIVISASWKPRNDESVTPEPPKEPVTNSEPEKQPEPMRAEPKNDFYHFSKWSEAAQWDLILSRPSNESHTNKQLHAACVKLDSGTWAQAERLAGSLPTNSVPAPVTNTVTIETTKTEMIETIPEGCVEIQTAEGFEIWKIDYLKSQICTYRKRNLREIGKKRLEYLMKVWTELGFNESDLEK